MKVSKTKVDGKHLYINILDFKDEIEWNIMYKKVYELIASQKTRIKVFD